MAPSIPFASTLLLASFAMQTAHAEPADYHTEAQFFQSVPITTISDLKAPDLKAIAAEDPNLTIREGLEDEPDTMVMLSDVLFAFGEADLAPPALVTLESLSRKLAGASGLTVTGHTDSVGSEDGNKALGLQRAEAVRRWLVESGGIAADVVTVASAGEAQPIARNANADGSDNPEGRALNRRVEFTIVEEVIETASNALPHPTAF